MLRKIYYELAAIRKELQALREALESEQVKEYRAPIDFFVPQDNRQ